MEASRSAGIRLLKIASVYLAVGLALGMFMAISEDHTLATVHSHLGLLGWVALAFTGFVYLLLPSCAGNRLATLHFWLHNLGLPVMLVGLSAMYWTGNASVAPVVAFGSTAVTLGLVLFVVNVVQNAT